MRRRHLTQAELASEAGVSQGTVSRVLRRTPKRTGRAYRRLCIYIQEQQQVSGDDPADIIDAVRRVWDGSERHATALAELITVSRRLWPELAEGSEDSRSIAQTSSAQLKDLGLAEPAIEAAWPRWWSEDAEASASARAELRFSVARRLGIDPGSLLDDREQPRFLWREEARFKHLASEDDVERAGIASFGRAVASAMLGAAPLATVDLTDLAAADLRAQLLASGRPYVGLQDLVALGWGVGIPVVYLRVFPWRQKRMAAMTVRVAERNFILLGKDAGYPAWISFYLAHELGHIALGHVEADHALVDLDVGDALEPDDEEERDADSWGSSSSPAGRRRSCYLKAGTALPKSSRARHCPLAATWVLNRGRWPSALGIRPATGLPRTVPSSTSTRPRCRYGERSTPTHAINSSSMMHLLRPLIS